MEVYYTGKSDPKSGIIYHNTILMYYISPYSIWHSTTRLLMY